ncbi:MAG TPA: helix-turn-helix transcriptional regulator [Acidimicrobiales bacterium]|nr:helix-turn-helix transcriptional regulator [Acidimicrobiales bacterium]
MAIGAGTVSGFGELLRRRREARGLEQAELARLLGVTQQTVSKWETGVTVPRPSRVAALARALGLDAGLLHAAAAEDDPTVGERRAAAHAAPAGIRLERLSQDELIALLEAAWQELGKRRGQAGTANQDPRR